MTVNTNEDISLFIPENITTPYQFEAHLSELMALVDATDTDEYDEYLEGARILIDYYRKVSEALTFLLGEIKTADTLFEKYQLSVTNAYATMQAYEVAVQPVYEEDEGYQDTVQDVEQYLRDMADKGIDPTM